MHKMTNLSKFELNWSSKLRDNNEKKNILVKQSCALSADAWFRDLKFYIGAAESYFFLEYYVTSEVAASHNVLYYQPLPFTLYQVMFYANNYSE